MNTIDRILADDKLRSNIIERLDVAGLPERFGYDPAKARDSIAKAKSSNELVGSSGELEAIIKLIGRPVLDVQNDTYTTPISDIWTESLNNGRLLIEQAIKSVGRIEVREHPRYEWLGTGWLVAHDVIVTNRHVAMEFAVRKGDGFVYRSNDIGRKMGARIDFKEERVQSDNTVRQLEFIVTDILHIEPDDDNSPDVAFLRIREIGFDIGDGVPVPLATTPVSLATTPVPKNTDVVVIGYPAKDSRNNSTEMERIFGSVYDVKRVAPGTISHTDESWIIQHDCSTLGGNSGSVVFDIKTGNAVGLHFGGLYKTHNVAVAGNKVLELLNKYVN